MGAMKKRLIIASLVIISVPFFTVQPVGTRNLAVETQPVVIPQVAPTTEALKPTPTTVIEATPVVQEPVAPVSEPVVVNDKLYVYNAVQAFNMRCNREVGSNVATCSTFNRILRFDYPEMFTDSSTIDHNLAYVYEYFRPGLGNSALTSDLYNNFSW